MTQEQIEQAVQQGTLSINDANEIIFRSRPLEFTSTPRGLVEVNGLIRGRKTVAFTPLEWERIAARMDEILEGIRQQKQAA